MQELLEVITLAYKKLSAFSEIPPEVVKNVAAAYKKTFSSGQRSCSVGGQIFKILLLFASTEAVKKTFAQQLIKNFQISREFADFASSL